ncbi:cuticle protein 16.5-like [Chrysoperla carnea]|uniref:cuticle protein 16.5-like n=1 Tax=Chrysoperla carnea TaxID=189513 RepID=UPI001D07C4B0|nr:cuticle protein 16.5-like [Chrysoperla carnea]
MAFKLLTIISALLVAANAGELYGLAHAIPAASSYQHTTKSVVSPAVVEEHHLLAPVEHHVVAPAVVSHVAPVSYSSAASYQHTSKSVYAPAIEHHVIAPVSHAVVSHPVASSYQHTTKSVVSPAVVAAPAAVVAPAPVLYHAPTYYATPYMTGSAAHTYQHMSKTVSKPVLAYAEHATPVVAAYATHAVPVHSGATSYQQISKSTVSASPVVAAKSIAPLVYSPNVQTYATNAIPLAYAHRK